MSKMLDKVSKLLAQAENAGTPEEASAFMAKAQELAVGNGIELAVARAHQARKERTEFPEERRIQVNPYNRRINRKHFTELAMYIADVNDVRYLIGGGDYSLHAVGFPSDLDVVEALFTHLSLQMVTQCDAALKRGDNTEVRRVPRQTRVAIPEDARPWGELAPSGEYYYNDRPGYPNSPSSDAPATRLEDVTDDNGDVVYEERRVALVDGRLFRHEFYGAFTSRIHSRLWEAKRAAMKDAGVEDESSGTGLALRNKTEEVSNAHAEQRAKVHHLSTWHGSNAADRGRDHTGSGRASGQAAAESAPLAGTREIS